MGTSPALRAVEVGGNPFRLPGLGTDSEPGKLHPYPGHTLLAKHTGKRLKLGGVPWWPNREDSMLSLP